MDQNKKQGMGAGRLLVLIVAIAVFCYSAFRLFTIYSGYKAADDEYSSLSEEFTKPSAGGGPESAAADAVMSAESMSGDGRDSAAGDAASGSSPSTSDADAVSTVSSYDENTAVGDVLSIPDGVESDAENSGAESGESGSTARRAAGAYPGLSYVTPTPEEKMLIEDAKAPIEVDWKELKAINPDIVGWIYIDGQDNISYPVCRAEDNDFYLHQTFRRQYLYAGSIFEDYHNKADFADPNTIVYGHNMKNGSMFGMLKYLNDQKKYDEHPFFWILTPEGNYRYHIFAIFNTAADSDTYTLYSQNGPEFLAWEKKMQKQSGVKNTVPLSKNDKTVILSTCTSDSSVRCVVIGKCVSSVRPKRRQAKELTTVKAP